MVGRIKVTLSKSKEESLTKSHRRFKKVSEPDKGKFSRLPTWLNNVSYRYEKEFTNQFPNKYYHYERGTIIRVDFGVNMGSEFSLVHFAIVLDKKDNARKKTLTVLPLTSKQKKGRYSLGKEIFNQTTTLLELQMDKLAKKISQASPSELTQELRDDLNELKKVVDVYMDYNKESYVRLSDITTISKFRIKRINKFDPSGKIKLSEQQMSAISNQLMKLYISGKSIDA